MPTFDQPNSSNSKPAPLVRVNTITSPTRAIISPASTFRTLVNDDDAEKRSTTSYSPGYGSPHARLKHNNTSSSLDSGSSPKLLSRSSTLRVEDEALHGYPKLATFIGGKDGCAIYKRFASLNARNLLYHQAKLCALEHELNELEQEHATYKHLHYKIDHIFTAEPGSQGYALHKKHEEVSEALDKYNRMLLEQKRLHELPTPDDTYVNGIYNFIHNVKAGDTDWLQHPENTIYLVYDDDRTAVQKDLITLNPYFATRDTFTKLFINRFIYIWHSIVWRHMAKPDDELDGYNYRERTLDRYMDTIIMLVSSLLPTTSIVALYFIDSAIWRLIFIVFFSAIFSAALAFFTDAKRVEIFAASVAMASVQVVFVGTAFGNGSNGSTN